MKRKGFYQILLVMSLSLFVSVLASCNSTTKPNDRAAMEQYIKETPTLILLAMGKAENGDNQTLKQLIASKEEDINVRDKNGNTALMAASRNGIVENVKALLEAKADISLKNNRGETALSLAEKKGYQDVVDMLKSAGAQ